MTGALRSIAVTAALAASLCACARHGHRWSRPAGMSMPIMPLAHGHIPAVWTPRPAATFGPSLPMRIDAVALRGRFIRTSWDATEATSAISFSADGRNFAIVGRSAEPDFEFLPPAAHGVIRIFVTDGTRRNQADYRL